MNETKQLRCKAIFDTNIEKINPLFSKVKIRIAYTGTNRNNSYISRESFEKALPTIYNCPIIGEFIEAVEDFGSHGGKIEISDKGIKYIQTTKPYGIINESSEITWEDIVEVDGTINTYLCATGYLWTGRYEELESVITNSKSQSMEIEISNGKFKEIDGKQSYAIEDFVFSAFCILGDTVEPCFESSEITSYNFNKEDFKSQFTEMVKELQISLNQSSNPDVDNIYSNKQIFEKEDKILEEKIKLLEKYNLTVETISFSIEELSLEEIESKIKEQFSLSNSQLMTEINKILQTMTEVRENYWGELHETHSFYLMDLKDNHAIVVTYDWDTYYGIPYIENGDIVTLDFESKIEYIPDWRPKQAGDTSLFTNIKEIITNEFTAVKESTEATINEVNEKYTAIETEKLTLQTSLDDITAKYTQVEPELVRLKEFQATKLSEERTIAEAELFSQFEENLKDDEKFEDLKKNSTNFTLEELEKELALLYVKKTAKFSFNKKQTNTIKIKVEYKEEDYKPYGDLIKE